MGRERETDSAINKYTSSYFLNRRQCFSKTKISGVYYFKSKIMQSKLKLLGIIYDWTPQRWKSEAKIINW